MSGTEYSALNRAQLSYDYLHTNSTTHEFLFGAIVELVDNSRDAHANNMKIFTIDKPDLRGGKVLCFLDDGSGMDKSEAVAVMTFGYSGKRLDPSMVGQYGNGLKSGAMRIGKDFILFTKKSGVMTIVFLSRTFHEIEKIDDVVVPSPSFTVPDKKPCTWTDVEKERFSKEMELILKYSPFKSADELYAQFDKIDSESGTLVMVYNLRLLDSGEPELDFGADGEDIRISDPDGGDKALVPEKSSLRAYLEIVYANPRMKIYLQGRKVRTRRVIAGLHKVRQYHFKSTRFKARAIKEAAKAQENAKLAADRASESESKLRHWETKHGTSPTDRVMRATWRQLQDAAALSRNAAKTAKDIAKEKDRSKNEPKGFTFFFGFNLERRNHDGCMIYNNGRLIKMYEQVGSQLEGGVKCSGVVGVVDVPYVVLDPTHNKQDFADAREYRALLRAMADYMEQYWRDVNLAARSGGVLEFWRHYGYISNNWSDEPSSDVQFATRRLMSIVITLQCDECLKWREIPFSKTFVGREYPEHWTCKENQDKANNNCNAPEKKGRIPEGKLDRALTSIEDAEKKAAQLKKKMEADRAKLEELTRQTERRSSGRTQGTSNDTNNDAGGATSVPRIPKKSAAVRAEAAAEVEPEEEEVASTPEANKPKTKADLRRQMEASKKTDAEREEERRRAADEEKRRKKKEDEKKKLAKEAARRREEKQRKLEKQRKREAAAKKAAAEEKRRKAAVAAAAAAARRRAQEDEEESEEEEEEEEEEDDDRRRSGRKRTGRGHLQEDEEEQEEPSAKQSNRRKGKLESNEAQISSTAEVSSTVAAHDEEKLVTQHKREADDAKDNLSKLRRNISKLIAEIDSDFAIPSKDIETKQVDTLLEECYRQILEGKRNVIPPNNSNTNSSAASSASSSSSSKPSATAAAAPTVNNTNNNSNSANN